MDNHNNDINFSIDFTRQTLFTTCNIIINQQQALTIDGTNTSIIILGNINLSIKVFIMIGSFTFFHWHRVLIEHQSLSCLFFKQEVKNSFGRYTTTVRADAQLGSSETFR